MAAHGPVASDVSHRVGVLWLVMAALALPGHMAWADQANAASSRFRIEAQLRPAEARYALTAKLRATAPVERGRERYTVKQLNALDAACEAPGDAIFADQFE